MQHYTRPRGRDGNTLKVVGKKKIGGREKGVKQGEGGEKGVKQRARERLKQRDQGDNERDRSREK